MRLHLRPVLYVFHRIRKRLMHAVVSFFRHPILLIYANDPRGVWDGERKEYRNVSSMDRGAATESEIAYVDALDATYKSLVAMVKNK